VKERQKYLSQSSTAKKALPTKLKKWPYQATSPTGFATYDCTLFLAASKAQKNSQEPFKVSEC